MKTNILILAFLICFTGIIVGQKSSNGKLPKANAPSIEKHLSVDTPRYYYRSIIDATKIYGAIDTLNLLFNDFGVSMSVEQARQYKTIATRQVNKLITNITLDSAKLSK